MNKSTIKNAPNPTSSGSGEGKHGLIDRQAAVDIVDFECGEWRGLAKTIIKKLEALPAAQPEIIRCKDCKHHFVHRCMDSIPTEICDLNQKFYDVEVDFCSLAERRTE